MNKTIQTTAGWLLSLLISSLLLISAFLLIADHPEALARLGKWGLNDFKTLLVTGALIAGVAFLVPRLLPLGTLLVSSYLGGAVATHLQHNETFVMPLLLLTLVWVAAYLRNPGMFVPSKFEKPGQDKADQNGTGPIARQRAVRT